MRSRLKIVASLLVGWLAACGDLSAQTTNQSGATEEFSAQLDVAYEMRPRVGLFGITELMMAALEADLTEVRRLVEQGADLEERDDTGGTPLMWAVQGGDLDVVNFLLDSGADVRATGGRNATALMIAVISGKEDIGVRLLEAGATFGGELSYQQDYLEYAAASGHPNLVRALIEHGAKLDESGADALCFASKQGHIDVVRVLIDAGADVNQRGNLNNDLPLIHAFQANDEALVRLLVDSGADVNLKDKSGRASMLYLSTQTGRPAIVSYLLENGASIGEEEANQLLSGAIYKGSMEMADLFLANGATLSTTHLFHAIGNKHFEMADNFAEAIGIESLDDYVLDGLVDQAANSGHQAMLDELLLVIRKREGPGQKRLLFETREGEVCRLNAWDPQQSVVTSTVLEEIPCDAGLFTSRHKNTLFVLQGERIDVHSLAGEFPAYSLAIPARGIEARLEEFREMFAQQWAGTYDWVSAEVATIGYLDDGRITLVTHTGGPADGTYASQFAWDGSAWTLINTQSCGRFDWICYIQGVDGQSIDRWPMRRAVWHAALRNNPGFVERVVPAIRNDDGAQGMSVTFDFDGQRAGLDYILGYGDHCSVECTFTDSVTINPGGSQPVQITPASGRVSIAGQFLLVRPARERSRLYDLVTGEDLLGDIGRATWTH